MNIAFYAPMKPASSPIPSGDRRVARALIAALESTGHSVETGSEFVSYLSAPDPFAIQEGYVHARELAIALATTFRAKSPKTRPNLWFTYHVYYKAPDWIGPAVADALGIPYVIAEASFAPKRADGPWDINHRGVEAAIRRADLIFGLNSADEPCVRPLLKTPDRLVALKPFLPAMPVAERAPSNGPVRLVTVAMMRAGAKLESYQVLARALGYLPSSGWTLTVVGDGSAEAQVRGLFAGPNVTFVGRSDEQGLAELYAQSDLFLWPAVDEAYGMAILEAQRAGLPVVAGKSGGVGDVVADGETGILTPTGDAGAFAEAVAALIGDPKRRQKLGLTAMRKAAADHDFAAAAQTLDTHLKALVA
jgi:glycosyltransferase involved in cell wall biosynthesis